ncbi:replicative DNA helicase [Streptomyces sp. 8L]|nr:replicative DNA helicase [Streptomyces sp. 8L]MCA1223326.1 replicative DNA helicase [Streptomyces sp. 8L]
MPAQTADRSAAPHDYGSDPEPGDFERVPPQDLAAEMSVLGSMMLSKDAIEEVTTDSRLKPRDFYKPVHETIFNTIIGLYVKGEPVDPITVTAALINQGDINRIGGAPYLHQLVEEVPTAANAGYYADIVKDRALRRRTIQAGTKIAQLGYGSGEVQDIVDAAGQEVFQIADEDAETDYELAGDSMEADLDALDALCHGNGEPAGVPTGFTDLDSLTSGLQPEQFVIVAARPAMGKSTLALDFIRAASCKHGIPSVLFSLEMGRREINQRLWSAEGKIALHHIRNGTMSEDDWSRLAQVMPRLKTDPFYVDASPNLTLMDIRTKARRLVQRHGVKLILVDYIQLMQSGGRGESRQEEVSSISRNLKLLAKELHVPVVGLSQLNRGPEQRVDKKPMVSDLRESGSLEQDADMVILLHREDAYEKESPRAGEADLIVAKHRNGPTATVTVAFQGHYSRFVDMAQS